ncbi:TlpA disulfide reductase family protein [Cesiribacter sp. SM1]|uniref:TlpA disulfide reductase family protein n=1 Tax=Cesiribacter sp. SM1 TaxID=2861196 RepID=UPI001CD7C9D9|nr:TlpA disulfide reductase family protein [Cesiribacter sp. SM1]
MTQLRQLGVLVLLACAAVACSNKGSGNGSATAASDGSVLITGKIENAPAEGHIVLEEIQQNQVVPLDTFPLENKAFSEQVKVEEPGFYRLNLYNKQFVTLVLNDENVLVNADLAGVPGSATVEGSTDTRYMEEINKIVQQKQQEVTGLEQQFLEAQNQGNSARMEELRYAYMQTEKELREDIKAKLRNMESSVTAIYGVNYLNKEDDFTFLDSLATRLRQDLPNSRYVKDFAQGVERMRSTTMGQVAPEIALPNPQGEVKKLSDLRGNVVMIDFWAAWCGPCRRENPNVVRLYNKYHDKGFEIYGVSLDRSKDDWVKAIEKDGLTWTQVSDLNYFNSEAAQTYDITAIPATVLLDKDGKIIARNLRGQALEDKLAEIFGE